jgi:hypothetical protein
MAAGRVSSVRAGRREEAHAVGGRGQLLLAARAFDEATLDDIWRDTMRRGAGEERLRCREP